MDLLDERSAASLAEWLKAHPGGEVISRDRGTEYIKGEYYADLVVESAVIIDLKAVETLHKRHSNQLINYLRATEMEVGLLLNFGNEPQVVRKIFTNDRKKIGVNPQKTTADFVLPSYPC